MVLFGSKKTHCVGSMDSLSKLRQKDSLCDAYLIVDDQRMPAHRCVLVTGSDYFRARFLGQLRDDDKADVDLSIVVSDAACVKKVIDFVYEGVIDINQENLESFLKLASFLLIAKLKDYCSIYMEKTLSVNTIVKYYILAADHAIDAEKSLKETLKTRFHDWLIFNESLLRVTPDQIRFLMKTCNIFDYCSYTDILKFITDWVKHGKSKTHDVLGCEILEVVRKMKLGCSTDQTSKEEKSNIIEGLRFSLQDNEPDSVFMINLQQLLEDLKIVETDENFTKPESPSEQLDTASSVSTISASEPVLLTISPKPCLKKALEKRDQTNTPEDNELPFERTQSIFDICAYVPRKKAWYRLNEGQYSGLYKNIVYEEGCWHFTAHMDKMFCLSPYARCYGKEELDILNLHDFSFRRIAYYSIRRYLQPGERSFDNMCIVADDNTVYLVSLISDISFDLEPKYFKCFKLTSRNKWMLVFRSPTFEDSSRYRGIVSAAFSARSNEMLLIFGVVTPRSYSSGADHRPDENPDMTPCELFAFIAEIGSDTSEVQVSKLPAGFHVSRSWQILQDENQFYLLEDEHLNGGFRLAYKYKYVYHSKVLTTINSNEEVIGESIVMKGDEPELLYVQHIAASNDGRSAWFFKGNDQNASTLTEAYIDSNGNTVVQAHKPPPFTSVTAFMAGKVNVECFARATPVSRYLEA